MFSERWSFLVVSPEIFHFLQYLHSLKKLWEPR
ncbi:unnamed protein product, partial [Didymodactylos carnosus]